MESLALRLKGPFPSYNSFLYEKTYKVIMGHALNHINDNLVANMCNTIISIKGNVKDELISRRLKK